MTPVIDIPFILDTESLLDRYRIQPGTDYGKKFESLVQKVQETGKPKALYTVSYIDEKGEDSVTIDGIVFTSIALRKNLDSVERVVPYIATCGTEVDHIQIAKGDTLESFWMYYLKSILLESAMTHLMTHIDTHYKTGKLSSMNPGSGDEVVWPISQQKELFSTFTDVQSHIGVQLSESSVLIPEASLMGIFYQTEVDFQSCQLCHREKCPSRRAPFNEDIWKSTYSMQ